MRPRGVTAGDALSLQATFFFQRLSRVLLNYCHNLVMGVFTSDYVVQLVTDLKTYGLVLPGDWT